MEIASTWRDLLERVLQDPQERQRIAHELKVNTVTLSRWAHHISNPRMHNLRRLLEVLPLYRSQLLQLISVDFPDFTNTQAEDLPEEGERCIPATFYARVFDAYTTTPKIQRFWTISNLVLQQALEQLDPYQQGMAILIVQCMPPRDDNHIYSLRERAGHGTRPWSINLEQHAIFLGAESLASTIVSTSSPMVLQRRDANRGFIPAHWVEWEESAAGYPFLRSNKVAGCLLVSSTQADYFFPHRLQLIQYYAELLSFVLEAEEFYDIQQINLRTMPHYREQEKQLATFRSRVANLMMESLRNKTPMNLTQAEQIVWQQIERELLHHC